MTTNEVVGKKTSSATVLLVPVSGPSSREAAAKYSPGGKALLSASGYRFLISLSSACSEGPDLCAVLLTLFSLILILATLPFSLLLSVKVVQVCCCRWGDNTISYLVLQEYERAVIFRLGRLLSGGAKGPGVFFIIPCVDIYEKIDMRTATYEIPPQEVRLFLIPK